jgi:hypothetical protein
VGPRRKLGCARLERYGESSAPCGWGCVHGERGGHHADAAGTSTPSACPGDLSEAARHTINPTSKLPLGLPACHTGDHSDSPEFTCVTHVLAWLSRRWGWHGQAGLQASTTYLPCTQGRWVQASHCDVAKVIPRVCKHGPGMSEGRSRRRRSEYPAVTGEASTTRCRVLPAQTNPRKVESKLIILKRVSPTRF